MPDPQGIYDNLSPREIVMGQVIDINKHCNMKLGSYVEAHKDIMVTNTRHPQIFSGINLVPTGNIKGALKVFDIKTSVVKKPRTMIELPMPDRVITIVDK